jgi:hypothetical protein
VEEPSSAATTTESDDKSALSSYSCITRQSSLGHREAYDIVLPEHFVDIYRTLIEEGMAHVCISGGYISQETESVVIPDGRRLRLLDDNAAADRNRRLQEGVRSGTKRLLAVRIVSATTGEEPEENLSDVTDSIFGTDMVAAELSSENATVVAQYRVVSAGNHRGNWSRNQQRGGGSGG